MNDFMRKETVEMKRSQQIKPSTLILWWAAMLLLGSLYCLLISNPFPSSASFDLKDLSLSRLIAGTSLSGKIVFSLGTITSVALCIVWWFLSRSKQAGATWTRILSLLLVAVATYLPFFATSYLAAAEALELRGFEYSEIGWRLPLSSIQMEVIGDSVKVKKSTEESPKYQLSVRPLPNYICAQAGPIEQDRYRKQVLKRGPLWSESLAVLVLPLLIRKVVLIGWLLSLLSSGILLFLAYLLRYGWRTKQPAIEHESIEINTEEE